MKNFQTLTEVICDSAKTIRKTAERLEEMAAGSHQAGQERTSLLAKSLATARHRLAEELRRYSERAPESVSKTYVQYTPETSPDTLYQRFRQETEIDEAVAHLQHIDKTLQEVFDFVARQDSTPTTKDICERAVAALQQHKREITTTTATAVDI